MNSFILEKIILEKKLPTLWKEPPLGGRGLAFHRPCQQRKRKGEMRENVGGQSGRRSLPPSLRTLQRVRH